MTTTHLIGLLLGTEDDWPTAFEPLRRLIGADRRACRRTCPCGHHRRPRRDPSNEFPSRPEHRIAEAVRLLAEAAAATRAGTRAGRAH